jgi:hypothetical protein
MNAKLKMITILTLTAALILFMVSCTNPASGLSVEDSGLSVEDRIAGDLAEIKTESETLLEDPNAAKTLIIDLIERVNSFVASNTDYLAVADVTLLNEIVGLLQEFSENIDYNDQLVSFVELLGIEIVIPADPTPAEYFAIAIQVETYRGIYGISSIDAENALVDYGVNQVVTDTIFDLIDGVITLEDLMVDESGMYINEEEGVVIGLPLEEDIPVDSPITVYGTPTIVTEDGRTGMEFNSADDYLIIPADDTNNLTDEGTIDLWIRPYSIPTWGGIIHKGSENDWSDESYSLQYTYNNVITLALNPVSGGFILVRGTTDMATRLNVWTHVVVTWNEDEAHIYIDDVDDTAFAQSNYTETPITFSNKVPFKGSTGDVVVGKQVPADNYQFDGVISDVKIYDNYIEL